MIRFLLTRLTQAVVVILSIITITFFMTRAAPGGPFSKDRKVSPQVLEQLQAYYGLNDPPRVQYWRYLKNLAHGDFGPCLKFEGRTVSEIIAGALPISLQLGLGALVIALVLGIPAGVVAAARQNSPLDYFPMALAMVGICLPTFVMGPILALVLGLQLHWFNVSGWFDSTDGVLPSLTLGLYYAAYVARLARGGMLEVLGQDFIRTARAKGVPGAMVVIRHAMKSGLLPVVSFLGPALAGMITGSFIIENVFQVPGLGQHFVSAASNRDYFLLLGATIVYSMLLVGLNMLVDGLQVWLNPKLRIAK